ncbi:hypothetical protein [Alicyclobacillus dauci]|uniref:Uncharacterized protein n=1 Tax=Alicyclobacillus dauci TaxID=1475485 RepID=A0ABY6Z5L9_9BACL|nr:hypothetical protein [Alicyclobacillus dauci]WAH38050.1 hypothetical protein NZD86_06055 [Alicyclobacillus dauci]
MTDNSWLREIAERVNKKNEVEFAKELRVKGIGDILVDIVTELQETYNVSADVQGDETPGVWNLRIDDKIVRVDVPTVDGYAQEVKDLSNGTRQGVHDKDAIKQLILDQFTWNYITHF